MGVFFITIICLLILLFFPIFLETDAHYDVNRRKFAFSVFLYKWIKLIGGYIATYQGGLALHISEKKAIVIPYSDLDSERKRFSFIRTFHLYSFILTTETGAEYLLPMGVLQGILRTYFFIIGGKKERIENNLWLTDGDVLRISLNVVIDFNLFLLVLAFFKFLKEKMILWTKKIKNLAT